MIGSDSLVSRFARTRSFLLAAALLAALVVLSLFVARAEAVPLSGSADPLPGSNFEGGDGNQAATAPRVDWQNASGVNAYPDPNLNDNIFAGGSEGKENNPGNWNFTTLDGGSTPGKNNILDAYSRINPETGDVFLNLAFTRGADTGTTFMAFELNQRPDLWNNGKADIPCRTTGDIIVSVEVSGNNPDVILQKWTTTGATDAATGCAKTGSLSDFTAFVDNVDAQGAVNVNGPIQNYLPSSFDWGATNMIPAKRFGEASLNLTTLLEHALGTPCFSFGSIWMHTRASTSDSSNLDDYIAPNPLIVRNCTASGTKFHDLDADGVKDVGEPGLAGFRIWADYDNDGVRDAGEPFDDTDANGDYSIADVQDPSGTYSLREQLTPPATGTGGWICSAPSTTGPGGEFPCAHTGIDGTTTPNASGKDFGNHKKAKVIIRKLNVGGAQTDQFPFTTQGLGAGFDLAASTVAGKEIADVEPNVKAGAATYSVTEGATAGYTLTELDCDDADSTQTGDAAALTTGTATIEVGSGETVTCTFTNEKDAKVTVVKDAQPNGARDFAYTTSGSQLSGFSLDDDADATLSNTKLFTVSGGGFGTKTITEEPTAGWSNTSLVCSEGSVSGSTATLSVDPGDDITCTYTNKQAAKLTVVKDARPNAAQDFDFTTVGLSDFSLDDDADDALLNSKTFTVEGDQLGVKRVTEESTDGWSLTDVTCSKGTVDGATVTVDLAPGDDVTCTYTNKQDATVTVVKDAVPNDDQDFSFSTSGLGDGFDLDDDGDEANALPSSKTMTVSGTDFGAKTVTEAPQTGWDLADITCTGDDDVADAGATATLDVDPGETIVCTFTNTKRAKVEIVKATDPANFEQDFGFTTSGPHPEDVGTEFTLNAGSDPSTGTKLVRPGHYTVAEDVLGGWDLESVTCTGDDGEGNQQPSTGSLAGADLDLQAGDEVRCVFTNTKRGQAVVVKTEGGSDPEAGHVWTFTLNGGPDGVELREQTDGDGGDEGVVFDGLKPGSYTLCEVDMPAGWHSSLEQDPRRVDTQGQASVCIGLTIGANETEELPVDNVKPDIELDKTVRLLARGTFAKTAYAHVGDTVEYRFLVTNPGIGELSVEFSDPRCDAGTLTEPKGDADDDGKLDKGETWEYRCTHKVTAQDKDPLPNTATVKGTDTYGNTDTDTSSATVDVIHPAIDIEKTGPATAKVGTPLAYTLTVTNPGDTPFAAQEVGVSDPRCEQPPTGPSKGNDTTPNQLDPGDTWTYTCTAQTAGQPAGTFVNTVTVTTRDFLGRTFTDRDEFPTVLEAQAVLPATPGSARLSGPSGCVRKPFKATVRGSKIARVTFFRDGKRIKTITAKPGQTKFRLRIKPSRRPGVHRITARVEFEAGANTKARTLRLSYQRCARQIVRPRFTG